MKIRKLFDGLGQPLRLNDPFVRERRG